jgi:hypothetical protein
MNLVRKYPVELKVRDCRLRPSSTGNLCCTGNLPCALSVLLDKPIFTRPLRRRRMTYHATTHCTAVSTIARSPWRDIGDGLQSPVAFSHLLPLRVSDRVVPATDSLKEVARSGTQCQSPRRQTTFYSSGRHFCYAYDADWTVTLCT